MKRVQRFEHFFDKLRPLGGSRVGDNKCATGHAFALTVCGGEQVDSRAPYHPRGIVTTVCA
eukprot:10344159-Prorocentrum_lima.AAC.1